MLPGKLKEDLAGYWGAGDSDGSDRLLSCS